MFQLGQQAGVASIIGFIDCHPKICYGFQAKRFLCRHYEIPIGSEQGELPVSSHERLRQLGMSND